MSLSNPQLNSQSISRPQSKDAKRTRIIFDYQQVLEYNNHDLSNLDLTMVGFFSQLPDYHITKEMRFHFPNKFNIHFNKRRVRPKTVISDDPEVLKRLRSCLSKISDQNFDTMAKQINDILSAANYDWKDVSAQVYFQVIENIFLVPVYVKLLKELEQEYSKLVHHFHQLILEQLKCPQQFKDSLSEAGRDKTKRWQISNGLLIIEIFNQGKYSQQFMQETLKFWLGEISLENLVPLEVLIKVLPKLKELEVPEDLKTKLKEISNDKSYPNRLRLLLNLPRRG